MKNARIFSIVLVLAFGSSQLCSQSFYREIDLKGVWQAVENLNAGSLQNICHFYTLNFSSEKAGNMSFEINFLSEDNKYAGHYYGVVIFTYEVTEVDTALNKLYMTMAFQEPRFMFQEAPKNSVRPLPPDHLSYLEEFKQYLFNREEEYEITFEGSTSLVVEGFSLIKDSYYAYFQKGGMSSPCKNLIRN